jgi:cyanate permease
VLASVLGESDRRIATAINLLLDVCGVTLLAKRGGTLWPLAGCALFELAVGNVISLPPLIAQAELDRDDVLRAVAMVTAVNQALFAFAPGVFGLLRDLTGSYALPLALAAVLQLACAILILAGRPPVSARRPAMPPGTGS